MALEERVEVADPRTKSMAVGVVVPMPTPILFTPPSPLDREYAVRIGVPPILTVKLSTVPVAALEVTGISTQVTSPESVSKV